jgi:hypothetical protein
MAFFYLWMILVDIAEHMQQGKGDPVACATGYFFNIMAFYRNRLYFNPGSQLKRKSFIAEFSRFDAAGSY